MLDFKPQIKTLIEESIQVKRRALETNTETLNEIINVLRHALKNGNKILLFGNGGSAADAQHIAAEFVNRFLQNRQALPAIALTTDTSVLTSIANDYSFENIFSRQIEAFGKNGDVAIGITTSGNSPNVIRGIIKARQLGLKTIGFTGEHGGELRDKVDLCLCVPSHNTPRIQEMHITAAHIICELLEKELCNETP